MSVTSKVRMEIFHSHFCWSKTRHRLAEPTNETIKAFTTGFQFRRFKCSRCGSTSEWALEKTRASKVERTL